MNQNDVFIQKKTVMKKTSLSSSSIQREIRAGRFPESFKIGPNRVAWKLSEILEWMNSRSGGEI